MLLGRRQSPRRRVLNVGLATTGVTGLGLLLGYAASLVDKESFGWPPRPSSPYGVALGFALAGIVAFEMAIWLRKYLRGRRLGKARVWMRLHVWVGLLGLPVAALHAGLGFGGPLAAWTLVLFLLVIASGVYGLILQQWLPAKVMHDVPNETVVSQADVAIKKHVTEAARVVDSLVEVPAEFGELISGTAAAAVVVGRDAAVRVRPLVTGPARATLEAFHDEVLRPYLETGRRSGSPLVSRAVSRRLFARLRSGLPDGAHPGVIRLESLADLRRQWDSHARLNWWLHGWLLVHTPLSVLMAVLMVVHAIKALKYW